MFFVIFRWIEKIVPMLALTSMLDEPSSGSNIRTYLPALTAIGDRNDVLGFLRRHDAKVAAVAHRAIDRLLREFVELLNRFAVNVDIPGFTDNFDEPGLIYLA